MSRKHETYSIGSEAAIKMAATEWWKNETPENVVATQLFITELCMDFSDFHKALETVLMRPVWTHEFAYGDKLVDEYLGKRSKPSLDEIMKLIPDSKRIIVGIDEAAQ